MSSSTDSGAHVALLWILAIAFTIGAGIFSWNLTEPESFFGVLGFLLLWGVLSKVAFFLAMVIVKFIGGNHG